MIATIVLDPAGTAIAIQITSRSLHAVGFQVSVFADDGNTVLEEFTGDTRSADVFVKLLNSDPSAYKGCYIRGTFTIIAPDGKDRAYDVEFAVKSDTAVLQPTIPLQGKTVDGKDNAIATFKTT